MFERVRMIKDKSEIVLIKKALEIALDTFEYIKPQNQKNVKSI